MSVTHTVPAGFEDLYGFPLDDFQVAGVTALVEGRSTLVAAPTGAGKTVVGEFAVWWALEQGGKCFYTTPIKALSNQKFNDLVGRHGAGAVGLLTGDNSINGEAPIVVMTTEVLRNMLYEDSPTLRRLHAVVLDEVHYLADRERGAVWEEVIVQLPPEVQLACLSATVSNAEEFGAWLRGVRETCDVVISERRPVPLEHHYFVNDRIYPVFKAGAKKMGVHVAKARVEAAKQALSGVPNPDVIMLERRSGVRNRPTRHGRYPTTGLRLRPPRRADTVLELARRRWLPAIYFLFSRDGCNAAVEQLMAAGVTLTSPQERGLVREIVEARTAELPAEDLGVLGHAAWADALERGVAAHHAGMVPVFKETVEELFVRGLVKVCFATETLALGINMPARTVVIERLEKWSGQRHELLTPGQFTQLTGRAGRRGLDPIGHAVVLYQRDIDFMTVASLVGRRTEPLRSSFAPSYNMAVNLLRRHTLEEAEALLARSFAQFQADEKVSGEEALIVRNREALEGYERNLVSARGSFGAYWALRRRLSGLEGERAARLRRRRDRAVVEAIAGLREGDVVALARGDGPPDLAAVVSRTESAKGAPLAGVVTTDRRLRRVGPREFDDPPRVVGRVELPRSGGPRQAGYRKAVAAQLRRIDPPRGRDRGRDDPDEALEEQIADLRAEIGEHPVHADPALPDIEVWAERYDELLAQTEKIEAGVRRRTGSLVRRLHRIVDVLRDLGYVAGPSDEPRPTALGMQLAGLYAETDLVLAESLRRGAFDGLGPADLAATASVFTYEARVKEPPPPHLPSAPVRSAVALVAEVWGELSRREEAAGLPVTRPVDPGFADVAWLWASGVDLDEAIGDSELTAGDFVRNTKQVIDLCGQIRDAVDDRSLGATAREAQKRLLRGVVAYTGL